MTSLLGYKGDVGSQERGTRTVVFTAGQQRQGDRETDSLGEVGAVSVSEICKNYRNFLVPLLPKIFYKIHRFFFSQLVQN